MCAQLIRAAASDADTVVAIIQKRLDWMDAVGIRHWNVHNYLSVYPAAYFAALAEEGKLWLLISEGKAIAAVVLLTEDGRWADYPRKDALYVHNLVGDPDVRGAGAAILSAAEEMARAQGRQVIRLDCSTENAGVNRFYAGQGYIVQGHFNEPDYDGNLMEKQL